MSNRTQMRERLRLELGDTGAVQVWSDDLLDALLIEAVSWYSSLWPRQAVGYRDVPQGARAFDVPAGTLAVSGVECPPGRVLPQEGEGAVGPPAQGGGVRQSWSVWGGTVYLGNPASGAEVGSLKLLMRLLMPWPRPDPEDPWEGPTADERLLILWAAAESWAWLDGQAQKLGRASKAASATERYRAELEGEIEARKRAATSRILE